MALTGHRTGKPEAAAIGSGEIVHRYQAAGIELGAKQDRGAATYRDNPYADPYQGRQGIRKYWTTVTSDQRDVDFSYEVLSVSGNTASLTGILSSRKNPPARRMACAGP